MKRKMSKKVLSWLLVLIVTVSLFPAFTLKGNAAQINMSASVDEAQYYASGCLKSLKISAKALSHYGDAYGKIAVHNGVSAYDYYNPETRDGLKWPDTIQKDTSFMVFGDGDEFLWTDQAWHTVTVSFADGAVRMDGSRSLVVYLWTRSTQFGVYPDYKIGTIQINNNNLSFNGSTVGTPNQPTHTHQWQITGDNTAALTATCVGTVGTCDAAQPVAVSISAGSVTLPDSPYNAVVTGAAEFESVTGLKVHPLDTLGRVSYKYKAVGAEHFTDADLSKAQAGTYQAILFVTDQNQVDHSAFVEYTAIDPVKTAATGDNRPVEWMIFGLMLCTAMAAVAFRLDDRRRG